MVVSVKFAVVNFPKVPLPGVVGAEVEEVVVLEPTVALLDADKVEVDVVVALVLDEVLRLEDPPDEEVLNAVIVSKETVGFFSFPSFTCKKNIKQCNTTEWSTLADWLQPVVPI